MAAIEEPIPPGFDPEEPEWFDELEDLIDGGDVDAVVHLPPAQGWEITSERQAENVMRRLRRLVVRARDARAQAQTWREPIDQWEDDQLKRLNPGIEFYTAQLRAFGIRHRLAFPKEATVRLPSGEIPTRLGKSPIVEVMDEDRVLAWAVDELSGAEYETVVKTEPALKLTEFRSIVSCVQVDTPWCVECGAQLELVTIDDETGWTHAGDGAPGHVARPVLEWEARFGDDPVPGVSVRLPEITATVKPRT